MEIFSQQNVISSGCLLQAFLIPSLLTRLFAIMDFFPPTRNICHKLAFQHFDKCMTDLKF